MVYSAVLLARHLNLKRVIFFPVKLIFTTKDCRGWYSWWHWSKEQKTTNGFVRQNQLIMQKACSLGRHQFARVRVQHRKISYKGQLYVKRKKENKPPNLEKRLCARDFGKNLDLSEARW